MLGLVALNINNSIPIPISGIEERAVAGWRPNQVGARLRGRVRVNRGSIRCLCCKHAPDHCLRRRLRVDWLTVVAARARRGGRFCQARGRVRLWGRLGLGGPNQAEQWGGHRSRVDRAHSLHCQAGASAKDADRDEYKQQPHAQDANNHHATHDQDDSSEIHISSVLLGPARGAARDDLGPGQQHQGQDQDGYQPGGQGLDGRVKEKYSVHKRCLRL